MNPYYKNIFLSLNEWIKENPMSYDLLDIKTEPIFLKIIQLSQSSRITKILTAPLLIVSDKYKNLFRILFKTQKKRYAQAEALIARSYLAYYKYTGEQEYLNSGLQKLEWLAENTAIKDNFCWGQPYDWYSRQLIPKNTPRATVSTQTANAFLDAYKLTKEIKWLKIAIEACEFFISDFNWDRDNDGDICFSYTTLDRYHIHNANMLIAATLIRTWYFTSDDKFKEFGLKAMQFTLKHQNKDGSWYYWAPPDKIIYKIDHYHTGFVLESLVIIERCLGQEFCAHDKLEKGVKYYLENLFENKYLPRFTNKSTFPIDIQSCAQAIITLTELSDLQPELIDKARGVANWSIQNMYDKKGFFYYRMNKNKKTDKTPYMRWAESWMLRALTFLLK